MKSTTRCCRLPLLAGAALAASEPSLVVNVWPGLPPGESRPLPPEGDQTKDNDPLVAGRRIIKLGNVSTPQLAVYRPPEATNTGAAVVICPGGGFNILAYDLEGTEVAAWLNSIGVTGIVLKHCVPFRDPAKRWHAPAQDAHRAIRLVRSKAGAWGLDPRRIGILEFSAGGATAGRTALLPDQPQYTPIDEVDLLASRPDFALLIYPGDLLETGQTRLREDIKVPTNPPPMFFVHAFDDNVSVLNTLLLAAELKRVGGEAEVHVYDTGRHGYGLRRMPELPVTTWPDRAAEWLVRRGLVNRRE